MSTSTLNPHLLKLTRLAANEDEGQHNELARLALADGAASEIIIGGPILNDNISYSRLSAAIDELSGTTEYNDYGDALGAMEWGYRIGLMTGLRLARALEGGAK